MTFRSTPGHAWRRAVLAAALAVGLATPAATAAVLTGSDAPADALVAAGASSAADAQAAEAVQRSDVRRLAALRRIHLARIDRRTDRPADAPSDVARPTDRPGDAATDVARPTDRPIDRLPPEPQPSDRPDHDERVETFPVGDIGAVTLAWTQRYVRVEAVRTAVGWDHRVHQEHRHKVVVGFTDGEVCVVFTAVLGEDGLRTHVERHRCDRPTDQRRTDDRPTDDRPTDQRRTDDRPTDDRPTDDRPTSVTVRAGAA